MLHLHGPALAHREAEHVVLSLCREVDLHVQLVADTIPVILQTSAQLHSGPTLAVGAHTVYGCVID